MSTPTTRRPFFRRRKSCPFSGANAPKIDYKDVKLLSRYVSERGKIVPSRITAVSQKKLPAICALWRMRGAGRFVPSPRVSAFVWTSSLRLSNKAARRASRRGLRI